MDMQVPLPPNRVKSSHSMDEQRASAQFAAAVAFQLTDQVVALRFDFIRRMNSRAAVCHCLFLQFTLALLVRRFSSSVGEVTPCDATSLDLAVDLLISCSRPSFRSSAHASSFCTSCSKEPEVALIDPRSSSVRP